MTNSSLESLFSPFSGRILLALKFISGRFMMSYQLTLMSEMATTASLTININQFLHHNAVSP
ncbi:MAG: hypothetical protein AB4041_15395 [Microcystaceae cyanobacterium]